MSEKRRLIKNTGLIAIGNFGAKMVSFLLLPLYTSILSTSEYGTYDFVVAISAFLLPVVTFSMHEAMFRFIIDTDSKGEDFKKIITNSFLMVLLGMAIITVSMIGIGFIFQSKITIYVLLYVVANSFYVFSNNMLRGLGRIKEYAIVSSGKNVLQLVLNVIAIAVLRWGMEGLLFALCASEIISFVIVVSVSKMWKYINPKYFSISDIKPMLHYALPLIPNTLCSQIINLSDRLIISLFLGSSPNGIYSISYKFPNIIDTVYHFFYTAWSESASRVFSKGRDEANKYYQSLYEMIDNMMFSIILLMIVGMPIMFRVFVRGNYIEGFKYVPILMLAMYFASIAKFYSGIFTALKKTKIMAISTVIAAIVNIMVNILFIKVWGLYAAAVSTLLADWLLMIIRKKYLEEDVQFTTNYVKVGIRIVVVAIVFVFYSYTEWQNIIGLICIGTLYSAIENRKIVLSVIKKQKNKKD